MEYRTFDGSNNNEDHPDWGQAGTQLLRLPGEEAVYADGMKALAERPGNPREISNLVCRQTASKPNPNHLSDYVWVWGQFLDHELDITPPADPVEGAPIDVTPGDPRLPLGGQIKFKRSTFDRHILETDPRQQVNLLSSYIDGANVYGVSEERASRLRMHDGTGRLQVSEGLFGNLGDLLPLNDPDDPIDNDNGPGGQDPGRFFVSGDVRANEHNVLTCMHTLFEREHNRLCQEIIGRNPRLYGDDQEVFQMARKIVGGIMQAITYYEFLPLVLGKDAIPSYDGYKTDVNAGITNVFSTATYRLGHSMLSGTIQLGSGGGSLPLRQAFFTPERIRTIGIEPFLAGLMTQVMQDIDTRVVDDVREFLFTPPLAPNVLLDLPALNIQRGRDHGLPDYNTLREAHGLPKVTSFADITSDTDLRQSLDRAYRGNINGIDPWIGALAEDHVDGANVGPFLCAALAEQFTRIRDGDRFWYEHDQGLTEEQKDEIHNTRLSDVIRRNTNITDIQDNVFVVP